MKIVGFHWVTTNERTSWRILENEFTLLSATLCSNSVCCSVFRILEVFVSHALVKKKETATRTFGPANRWPDRIVDVCWCATYIYRSVQRYSGWRSSSSPEIGFWPSPEKYIAVLSVRKSQTYCLTDSWPTLTEEPWQFRATDSKPHLVRKSQTTCSRHLVTCSWSEHKSCCSSRVGSWTKRH